MREPGVDVVVPSYHRPRALAHCLAGLAAQELPATRVIVVARGDDRATWETAQQAGELAVTVVRVDAPGLVAALTAGVAATRAPRVAFTDDDAVPHPGWLAGLTALLDEPGVGGAGGRDLVAGELEPRRRTVGILNRYGRYVGDHHLGSGPAREVHVLKGVNMAYRADALALPRPGVLRGRGTEMHTEKLICSWARARGWRIVYDPEIPVDHRTLVEGSDEGPTSPQPPAPRDDARRVAWFDRAHNRMLGTIATAPDRAPVHVGYGLLVGCREAPGLVRAAIAVVRDEGDVIERLGPSLAGQWRGVRSARRLATAMEPCAALRRGA